MTHTVTTTLRASLASIALLCATALPASAQAHKLVDAVHESPSHLGFAAEDGLVTSSWERNLDALDFTDHKVGDFSLQAVVEDKAQRVGLTPGPFIEAWDLGSYQQLEMWVWIDGVPGSGPVEFVLIDQSGNAARHADLSVEADGAWKQLRIPLDELEGDASFQRNAVAAVQTASPLPVGATVGFDGAMFTSEDCGAPLGVTDMTYAQRMSEADATREARARASYRLTADFEQPGGFLFDLYAKLWLNEDVDEVNAQLLAIFSADPTSELGRKHEIHRDWSLWLSPYMVRLYHQFGSTSRKMPGRLYPDTEQALLELLWNRTQATNDIALTRKSTWWMIGSENHDIHVKADALISSQIFKNHPDFKDRAYENAGHGGGMGYWFHHNHGDGTFKGPQGNAQWADGNEYTAQDHCEAWTAYWKEYLRERVKKGFFLEVASQGYMKFTVSSIQDIYDKAEDPELKALAKDFLDLVWAEWAQDQLVAIRGGSKTRWYDRPYGAMFRASAFHTGGMTNDPVWWYMLYASDYRWPEYVWRMALDRQGKGDFAYISRKPGEEPVRWPRPAGLERTLICDTESRLVRYSWVTPDYILGTQMDHPGAVHSHLSSQNRWQGMTFAANPTATIAPVALDLSNPERWKQAGRASVPMYRSAQEGNVLITQQARRWTQQNPDWYPAKVNANLPYGVRFNGKMDALDEQDGWVFARVGDAYVGVRVVKGGYDYDENWTEAGESELYAVMDDGAYVWGPKKQFIRFTDNYSPVILHAGRADTHGDYESFKAHVLAGQVRLRNTVVPGWYVLEYRPQGESPRDFEFNVANSSIPSINGELVDYAPPYVFRSPFLNAKYDSGVVRITVDDIDTTLDFRPHQASINAD
ncbi:MAG: hypothetical protein AAF288_03475 [Planctomycetota bacterium]